ncbi:hypothetical protein P389DRAFT_197989 [Cystobasidium minutum MCA 4210]|uniref:uncharacterized protein n=1 Tax=Cystobasidium minutum MCA 4210 TaxID=1397322 RepID=UPI0034CF72D0|eukprot:jgi/Rhomi1/197989/gm1.6203_g
MGKRSHYSSSSESDYDSDNDRSKRFRKSDKGKGKERGDRYRLSKADELSTDDFYAKNKEFRYWLSHKRKPKEFIKMDSSDQRRYFKKFVRRWNKGKLESGYYTGSFFGESIAREGPEESQSRQNGVDRPVAGPSRPRPDDLILSQEAERERRDLERENRRTDYKRERKEAKREEQENRSTGRDRLLEKRAEQREISKQLAQSREQGEKEFDETFLLGAGSNDSFAAAIRKRDSSKAYQRQQQREAERRAINEERFSEKQKKENETMAMLKALAAARYGTGS